ncbi:MAG: hypothetical protein ABIT82_07440 [Ramlibacter sp.]
MTISILDLSGLLGSSFTAHTSSGALELKLVEATEQPRRGLPDHLRTPLSLLFAGPPAVPLAQDNYDLDHPSLGRNRWMLVPVSQYATPQVAVLAGTGADPARLYEVTLG